MLQVPENGTLRAGMSEQDPLPRWVKRRRTRPLGQTTPSSRNMTFHAAHPQETLHMSRTSPPKTLWTTPSRTRSSQTSPASTAVSRRHRGPGQERPPRRQQQFKETDAASPERNHPPSPRRSRRNNKGRPPQRFTGHLPVIKLERGHDVCSSLYWRTRCL